MNNIDSINNMNDTIDENSNKTDGEDKNEDNDSHIDEEYNYNNRIRNILYESRSQPKSDRRSVKRSRSRKPDRRNISRL